MESFDQFFKKNQRYLCKVVKIYPTYVILETSGITGICHISEISDYKVNSIHDFFKLNHEYHFALIDFNTDKSLYTFSFKRINPKLLKFHTKIIPTTEGFENLYEYTLKRLYEDK